jgi:hypothetical protein
VQRLIVAFVLLETDPYWSGPPIALLLARTFLQRADNRIRVADAGQFTWERYHLWDRGHRKSFPAEMRKRHDLFILRPEGSLMAETIFLGGNREPLSLGVLLGLRRSNCYKRNANEETFSFESGTQIEKFTELQAASPIDEMVYFVGHPVLYRSA